MDLLPPNARLSERVDVNDSLAIFRVVPDSGIVPAFEPGQFTNLGLPGQPSMRRAFTIASAPAERRHLEFYVNRVDDGRFTPLLWQLEPSAPLWLDSRVYGRFTLEEIAADADLLMIGTGTGIAPYLAMLRAYAHVERWRRCLLLESARRSVDLGYRSELEALAARDPRFGYRPTLTREPEGSGWSGLRGRVQTWLDPARFEDLAGAPLDPSRWHVFLCGNPAMIADVTQLLAPLEFHPHHRHRPGRIHAERYW